ncbi:MAG: glycosyltransferase [Proteobacteria bacterium]|nr:glycosyltransferase [Pseudomonadota bacterium]
MTHEFLKTISVLVITYNHEKYLAQALDGILSQKVDARLEIIIADDASTDRTLEIAKKYSDEYPGYFKVLSTPNNMGHTRNYDRAWKAATGEFIAHCDGDDYWTNPKKLSLQLSFLETNPNFSCVAHKVWAISEEDGSQHGPVPRTEQQTFDTSELLEACFPHNCSLFFRNHLFDELPSFFFKLTGHDWCIDILNSLKGPIKIMPDVMGVWRMRTQGLWGGRLSSFHLEHNVFFLTEIRHFLPKESFSAQKKHLVRHQFLLSFAYLEEGNLSKAKEMFLKIVVPEALVVLPKRKLLSLWAQIQFPEAYQRLRNLRNLTLGEPPAA